ncbi:universal stress protein [Geminicoccus harenae]|uniref:universal stress protein n=3 Tax=Geminicoccus harenae TaxID=2498453 RepID=UPI001C945003|nr:universal stress protein [Geminicoccus harenae]
MSLVDSSGAPTLADIIHPTDLTPLGERAFAHALALTLACKGHLGIVHAGDPEAGQDPDWTGFRGVRSLLSRWGMVDPATPRGAIAGVLGIRVSKKLVPGSNPVAALEQFLDEHGCDLLVLATRARGGLARLLSGSIAEELARHNDVPALFLPPEGRGFVDAATGRARLRNLLVPVDHATPQHEAVEAAFALADLLGCADALVHLLHVGPADRAPSVTVAPGQEQRLRRASAGGAVVPGIVATAGRLDADLIVMATHGHDSFLDGLRGSTTEQVLRQAGRAVLALPVL